MPLTHQAIAAAIQKSKTGKETWSSDDGPRGSGSLQLLAKRGTGHWYFRYTKPDGRRDTLPIGPFRSDTAKAGGFTLAEARIEAARLSDLIRKPASADIRAFRQRQAEEEHKRRAAAEALAAQEQAAAEARQRHTLAALCALYSGHLKTTGKSSAASVRRALERHVVQGMPELAARPAREINRSDAAMIVRGVLEKGLPRIAGLIRAYLHAAYELGIAAEGDPAAPAQLIPFRIESNPFSGIKPIAVQRRDRVLSPEELRHFLRRLDEDESPTALLIKAALTLGGQRPAQLARVTARDLELNLRILNLQDPKGRRSTPRVHPLPLTPGALALLTPLVDQASNRAGGYLFSHRGDKPLDISAVSKTITDTARAMQAAGECTEPFQTRDLRRTAETMLASIGASTDIRAQLLSHGLGGVQAQHYDRHQYLDEKLRVLLDWEQHLDRIRAGEILSRVVRAKFGRAA